jgi:hypothetical protein
LFLAFIFSPIEEGESCTTENVNLGVGANPRAGSARDIFGLTTKWEIILEIFINLAPKRGYRASATS